MKKLKRDEGGRNENTAPFDITITYPDPDTGEDRYIQVF